MGDPHLVDLDPGPVPPLKARLLGVLLDPRGTFANHDASWGWIGPWLVVALAGVLSGLIYLARIDVDAVMKAQSEAAFEQMAPAQRRALDDPKVQEFTETMQRFQGFVAKAARVAGPPVMGIVGLLVAGALLFGASRLSGQRTELMRSISIAAHAQAVSLVELLATTLGTLTGNHGATTSPAHLASEITQPVLHTALSRLDPVVLLYYFVIAAALEGSLRLPRRKAVLVAAGFYLAVSVALIAFVAAMAALGKMAGGGA